MGAGADATQVMSSSHELISLSPGSKILDGIGLGILLASVGMKEWLYQETMKISRKTDSSVLKANAWHHRVDALSAIVALVGVSGRFIGVPWLDPVAGAAVGAVVLKTGCEVGWKSLKELVDLSVEPKMIETIRSEADEAIPLALKSNISVVDVIARKAGPH